MRGFVRSSGASVPPHVPLTQIEPTFKQLSSLQAIGELMTSKNHYINIQLAKFISACFDLRNTLPLNQTDVYNLIAIS